ncbi:MAG: hypothetical protein JG768_747 [Fusobacteriales bacterium]|jgi:uncharacterized protein (TIGR02678 family)|nr:hypothetical protein [Fusobacteriales bacterium]
MRYEYLKEYIITILKNNIIYREDKKYFEILRYESDLKEYFREKFGYELIIKHELIKLERISDQLNTIYGIKEFNKIEQYIMFLLILDYLEEMESGRTILISDIVSYITENYPSEIDWKNYYINLSLIKVLRYCISKKILIMLDGSEQEYLNSRESEIEILYENTGISKYIMVYIPIITKELLNWKDYLSLDKTKEYNTKLCFARRALINNTIINYDNPAYEIILNNKEILENEFEIYFDSKLVVTKKFAYLLRDKESRSFSQTFPDSKNITIVTLLLCNEIKLENKIEYKKQEVLEILEKVLKNKSNLISNENKRKTSDELLDEIINLLEELNIIKKQQEQLYFSEFIFHFNLEVNES